MTKRLRTARTMRLAADERGFAVPTVILMMLAVFAVVSVALFASIEAQSGTVRDQSTKSALAAAETGVQQALFSYNGGFTTTSAAPCLMPVSGFVQAQAAGGGGWCNATPAQTTGASGLGSFTYRVCPSTATNACAGAGTIEVVSTGTYNGVTRRIDVVAKSASGQQVFSDAGVKSQTNLTVGSSTFIYSSTWSNNTISLGSSTLCGAASVGPSGTFASGGNWYSTYDASTNTCSGLITDHSTAPHQALVLPPVNEGDAATNNNNYLITNAVNGTTPADLITCSNGTGATCKGKGVTWDPTARSLNLTGQQTSLTLTGQTYSFCTLTMKQNSTLYVSPSSTQVRIFFDSPEACGLPPFDNSTGTTQKNTAQMYLESNTRIACSIGCDPSTLYVGIYFVGSATTPTGALLSSNSDAAANCVQDFIVYGPLTQFTFNSNSSYCGAIAGYSITMAGNNTFKTDGNSQAVTLPGTAPHYALQKFVDCSSIAPGSSPNSGC